MFKRLKEMINLWKVIKDSKAYIVIFESKNRYGANLIEKEIENGKIVEKLHQGKWCDSVSGSVMSVVNIRNSSIKKNKENDNA